MRGFPRPRSERKERQPGHNNGIERLAAVGFSTDRAEWLPDKRASWDTHEGRNASSVPGIAGPDLWEKAMEIKKLPPGEAIGARDLHEWSTNRRGGRSGVVK